MLQKLLQITGNRITPNRNTPLPTLNQMMQSLCLMQTTKPTPNGYTPPSYRHLSQAQPIKKLLETSQNLLRWKNALRTVLLFDSGKKGKCKDVTSSLGS